jgi:tol-pal system protein YbgF
MTHSRTFSSIHGIVVLGITALLVGFAPGCQTTRPDAGQGMAQLSAEIEEAHQKIEEIYHRVSVIQFMVDTHERTLADLEKNLRQSGRTTTDPDAPKRIESAFRPTSRKQNTRTSAEDPAAPGITVTEEPLPAPQTEPTADTIYNQGFTALKSKDFDQAMVLFQAVATRFPDHSLADNAIYWIGEIHYSRNQYNEAISTFKHLIDTYPDGGKVPDALLKIGYSYHALKDTANAVSYLKKVVVDYPFTVPGSKAEAMLDKIE